MSRTLDPSLLAKRLRLRRAEKSPRIRWFASHSYFSAADIWNLWLNALLSGRFFRMLWVA